MTPYKDEEGHKRLRMIEKGLSRLEKAETRNIPSKGKDTKKQAEEALYLLINRFFRVYNTAWHPEREAISRLEMLTSSTDWVWYHVQPSDDLLAKIIYPTFKKRFERWQERYKNVILLEKAGKE